jgi:hypothetical protein
VRNHVGSGSDLYRVVLDEGRTVAGRGCHRDDERKGKAKYHWKPTYSRPLNRPGRTISDRNPAAMKYSCQWKATISIGSFVDLRISVCEHASIMMRRREAVKWQGEAGRSAEVEQ